VEAAKKAAHEHSIGLEKVDALFGQMRNPERRIYANQYERSFLEGVRWAIANGTNTSLFKQELINELSKQAQNGTFIAERHDGLHYRDWSGASISLDDAIAIVERLFDKQPPAQEEK
jgi:hypothetical protein